MSAPPPGWLGLVFSTSGRLKLLLPITSCYIYRMSGELLTFLVVAVLASFVELTNITFFRKYLKKSKLLNSGGGYRNWFIWGLFTSGPIPGRFFSILSPFVSVDKGLEYLTDTGKRYFRLLKYVNYVASLLLIVSLILFLNYYLNTRF